MKHLFIFVAILIWAFMSWEFETWKIALAQDTLSIAQSSYAINLVRREKEALQLAQDMINGKVDVQMQYIYQDEQGQLHTGTTNINFSDFFVATTNTETNVPKRTHLDTSHPVNYIRM